MALPSMRLMQRRVQAHTQPQRRQEVQTLQWMKRQELLILDAQA